MLRRIQIVSASGTPHRRVGKTKGSSEVLADLQDVDDYSRDYVERDERRLADLGRRAVEMYAISHIFSELQVAFFPSTAVLKAL